MTQFWETICQIAVQSNILLSPENTQRLMELTRPEEESLIRSGIFSAREFNEAATTGQLVIPHRCGVVFYQVRDGRYYFYFTLNQGNSLVGIGGGREAFDKGPYQTLIREVSEELNVQLPEQHDDRGVRIAVRGGAVTYFLPLGDVELPLRNSTGRISNEVNQVVEVSYDSMKQLIFLSKTAERCIYHLTLLFEVPDTVEELFPAEQTGEPVFLDQLEYRHFTAEEPSLVWRLINDAYYFHGNIYGLMRPCLEKESEMELFYYSDSMSSASSISFSRDLIPFFRTIVDLRGRSILRLYPYPGYHIFSGTSRWLCKRFDSYRNLKWPSGSWCGAFRSVTELLDQPAKLVEEMSLQWSKVDPFTDEAYLDTVMRKSRGQPTLIRFLTEGRELSDLPEFYPELPQAQFCLSETSGPRDLVVQSQVVEKQVYFSSNRYSSDASSSRADQKSNWRN